MTRTLALPLIALLVATTIHAEARAPLPAVRGIYALDNKAGQFREKNVRDYPFVEGYAWRMKWNDIEKSKGVYDFSSVDSIVALLESKGLKLSVGFAFAPNYIAATTPNQDQVWSDADGVRKTAPWDPYCIDRYREFMTALANHKIGGKRFADLPLLTHLHAGICGIRSVRDGNDELPMKIYNLPGYTRAKFVEAVRQSLAIAANQFPNKAISVGFWAVQDNEGTPVLWQRIQQMIFNQFPGMSFFQENLAASADLPPGSPKRNVTGRPTTDYAVPLVAAKGFAPVTFQALQGWQQPFSDPSKTANGTPFDGMKYAHETFGTEYFEMYDPDLDHQEYWPEFERWARILRSVRK